MGLLNKIFGGGGSSIARLRKAVAQKHFVDARWLAEKLQEQTLSESDAGEVEQLRIAAGDGLARLNLDEALGLQRCENFEQAADHLLLAQEQAFSVSLQQEIEQALANRPLIPEIVTLDAEQRAADAGSPKLIELPNVEDAILADVDSQLELILVSYPADLAKRYAVKSELFKAAFLTSHSGQDEAALPLWQQVETTEHDDLYWFELGSLWARQGDHEKAQPMLETALEQNPELALAIEALIPILVTTGDYQLAEQRLQGFIDRGISPQLCYGLLATLLVQQQKVTAAAEPVRQALAAGNIDSRFLLLAASVLEQDGAINEAESALQKISTAGSRGGIALPLAEFWLRHKQQLGTILDTFNAACREHPDDLRWQLRVAQTYLARNWDKDGLKLLQKIARDPRLEGELLQEVEKLLTELGEFDTEK